MGKDMSLVINLLLTVVSAPLLNSDQLLSFCQLKALPQEETEIRSILGSEVHVCPRE